MTRASVGSSIEDLCQGSEPKLGVRNGRAQAHPVGSVDQLRWSVDRVQYRNQHAVVHPHDVISTVMGIPIHDARICLNSEDQLGLGFWLGGMDRRLICTRRFDRHRRGPFKTGCDRPNKDEEGYRADDTRSSADDPQHPPPPISPMGHLDHFFNHEIAPGLALRAER